MTQHVEIITGARVERLKWLKHYGVLCMCTSTADDGRGAAGAGPDAGHFAG